MNRKREILNGVVKRVEFGNAIVDIGRAEAILPKGESIRGEQLKANDRIRAYVKDVKLDKGHVIVLSRTDDNMLAKLFELEVPEIYEGIVSIVGVAREAGSRSKIAVASRNSDVDAVGACVGIKGSRVQAVVQELRGEKIDIVPYHEDPARYIINAIQPVDVNKVIVDEADHRMELVVPDEKLSLAIGRKGQNVRLAAQLTGWKLDIISESKFKQIEEQALGALCEIEGVDEELARAFYRLGFRALEEVAEATSEELLVIDGVSEPEQAEGLRTAAEEAMERLRQRRIDEATSGTEPLNEREKLRFVQGIGLRTIQLLEEAGYKNVRDVAGEDPERLAIRARLGSEKAAQVQKAAVRFLEEELPKIAAARATLADKLEAESKALEEQSEQEVNENSDAADSAQEIAFGSEA